MKKSSFLLKFKTFLSSKVYSSGEVWSDLEF